MVFPLGMVEGLAVGNKGVTFIDSSTTIVACCPTEGFFEGESVVPCFVLRTPHSVAK